ncbi:hypothetical protein [Methanolobus sp.]|uniref:hypothetical protein n=1 Tax=Methanolobus sp. TaxID=1874737 RepID=UPI0025F6C0CA|nr:hypothetical protein [Methanolobus sp.]
MKEADIITALLSDNWNSSNTGGVTPIIDTIVNRGNVDVRQGDFILTYNTGAGPITHSGIKTFDHSWTISIDIRSILKTRFDLHVTEVKRIIESKYISPAVGYDRLYMVRDQDLSDRTRGLSRRVIDVAIHQDLEEL